MQSFKLEEGELRKILLPLREGNTSYPVDIGADLDQDTKSKVLVYLVRESSTLMESLVIRRVSFHAGQQIPH